MAARTKVFVDIVTKSAGGKTPGAGLKKFAIAAAAAAVAVGVLIKVGKELVTIFAVQEQAEAKLIQTIKATGKAAGLTSKELFDMASGLQEVTKFGDEAIIGAQSLLLTFKDIGGDIFPRALESILDVSEAMGTDLKSSTIQLGKALNDPILGLTSLSRAGIQFTDDQKDLIKSLVETGDKAAAQTIILEELESQFGGVARAAADTSTGSLTQLNNTYGDIQETIGQVISEGIQPFVKELNREISVVNSSIKAHFLRSKAVRGEATVIEELTLRELEQAKTEDRLAQAKENVAHAESIVIDVQGISAIRARQLDAGRKAGIEQGKNLIIALEDELVLRKLSTETAQKQFDSEQKLLDVKLAAFEAVSDSNDALEDEEKAKNDLIEANEKLFSTEESINLMLMEREKTRAILTSRALNGIEQIDEAEEDSLAKFLELHKKKIQTAEQFANASISLITAIGSIGSAKDQAELQRMEEAGASEEELETKRKQIAHDEAIRTRNLAILSTTVNTASAIIGMLVDPGGFAGIALSLFAGATGLAQIAAATAAPIPSLATGGQFITDGPTLIGDNASGQERITVEPLGGGGGNNTGQIMILRVGDRDLKAVVQGWIDNRGLHSSFGGAI